MSHAWEAEPIPGALLGGLSQALCGPCLDPMLQFLQIAPLCTLHMDTELQEKPFA